jgi:tRNA (guanine9-N1)-methyltransferase
MAEEDARIVELPAAPAPEMAEDASAEVEVNTDTDAPSKRVERREKRRAFWEQKKEKKKQQRKEQKRVAGVSAPSKELDMSPEAVLRRRERQVAKRESFLMAAEEGVSVVIDCEFEDLMLDKEKKSLSQQIMFSYGINRRSHAPTKYVAMRGAFDSTLD